MSGVAKWIKKKFKKVTEFGHKVVKEFGRFMKNYGQQIMIAVLAYYTVGAAMGAYGGAAGATSGAGSGAAAGATSGAVSGAAVSGAAASPMWIGAGAGGAGGATGALAGASSIASSGAALVSGGMPAIVAGGQAAAAGGALAGAAGAGAAAAGGELLTGVTPTVASRSTQFAQPGFWEKVANAGSKLSQGGKKWWGGLSSGEKLSLVSQGLNLAAAATEPTIEEAWNAKAEAESKWRGAFYGMNEKEAAAAQSAGPAIDFRGAVPQGPMLPGIGEGGSPVPQPGAMMAAQPTQPGPQSTALPDPRTLFETPGAPTPEEEEEPGQPMLFGEGQMKQMIPVPEGLFSPTPGVRYI